MIGNYFGKSILKSNSDGFCFPNVSICCFFLSQTIVNRGFFFWHPGWTKQDNQWFIIKIWIKCGCISSNFLQPLAKTCFSFMHLFFVVVVRKLSINKVHLTTATASFLSNRIAPIPSPYLDFGQY